MGRYIRGDAGFHYKYIYAKQPANLIALGDASGAGRSGVLPVLRGSYAFYLNPDINEGDEVSVPCIPLLREIVADGVARGGEIRSFSIPPSGDILPHGTTEFLQYVLAENIGEALWRVDSRCLVPPIGLYLEGYGGYSISEGDYPKLMKWINRFLPAKSAIDEKKVAALRDKEVEEYFALLDDEEEFLPFMGLRILAHAVQKKLASFSAMEVSPEISAESFWELVQDWQYHEGLFDDREKSPRERFLRGLIFHYKEQKATAIEELKAAEAGGEARAIRYLDFLLKRRETIEAVLPPAKPLSQKSAKGRTTSAKKVAAKKSVKARTTSAKKVAAKKSAKARTTSAKKVAAKKSAKRKAK